MPAHFPLVWLLSPFHAAIARLLGACALLLHWVVFTVLPVNTQFADQVVLLAIEIEPSVLGVTAYAPKSPVHEIGL